MAQLVLKSTRQVQADLLTKIIADLGINDVNPGSVLDVLTAAFAQEAFAQYIQMAKIARLVNLDAMTGEDLDTKAFEFGLSRRQANKSNGLVDIFRPSSFVKVSTTFYAGSAAPIVGNMFIDVNNASNILIGTSGTLILGRGTANSEEVTYSSAPVDNTNYYRYTLDNPLTKNHAIEETIILKQGNDEQILAGTSIIVPPTGVSSEIKFLVDEDVVLLSGEDRVNDISITAEEPGTDGNIPVKAIKGESAFPTAPFSGARAENLSKFTTGRDRETDDELRDGIKNHIQSLSRGVKQAILTAIVGLVDPVTAKRVVSANVILPQSTAAPVKVYMDDGLGFEPSFSSVGFEEVIRQATGGETRLQLDLFPIVKAQIEANSVESWDFSGGAKTLIYEVGGISETITFNPGDFQFPDISTAEEVVTVINDRSTLIEARTSQTGKSLVIQAKADTNEDIQITGGSANNLLAFPTDKKETLYFYIDDIKQSKDGQTAILDSQSSAPYNLQSLGAFPHTLIVVVDGKTANSQTASIALADVSDPTAVTVNEIVTVLNRDLAGVTAVGIQSNSKVRLISNQELSSKSKIRVTGGTANAALDFSTVEVSGINGDFTLNRELGTIELKTPLLANQAATSSSLFTRAKLRAALPELYAPALNQTLVISVDGGSNQTVTFDASFSGGVSADATAAFINLQLSGAKAVVREVGGLSYIEIRSNTYNDSISSIEIKASSTANGSFGFSLDTVAVGIKPHAAYIVSQNSGPFNFAESDSLVIVVDDNIVDNTFAIIMDYSGTLTAVTSTSAFRDGSFINVFQTTDELVDFYVGFSTGSNTGSGVVDAVTNSGGNTYRYSFSTVPGNLGIFAIGDYFNASDFEDSGNNINSIITGVGADWVEITNLTGEIASSQVGTVQLSQRRRVQSYNASTGQIVVTAPFSVLPVIGNEMFVIPSTINNLVSFFNNTKITSFSLKGTVEGVDENSKLQLSSNKNGSDGYIQVTGGKANDKLNFDINTFRGLQGYNYYTGLLSLVHRTIYGDDTDLVAFPGVGAAGIQFQVLAPTVREVRVSVDVTLREGVSISSVENEIKTQITGTINNLGVGEDLIIEQIRAAIIGIPGIIDVVLNTPLANIAAADNEILRTRDSLILIG